MRLGHRESANQIERLDPHSLNVLIDVYSYIHIGTFENRVKLKWIA